MTQPVLACLELEGVLIPEIWINVAEKTGIADLRLTCQVIIVSDTFSEFALPLMRQLGYPTIFCNRLEIDTAGRIVNYHLRQPDQKRASVLALKGLQFRVLATGDAYNDTSMLGAADAGVFFRPPQNVAKEFPQFPVVHTYEGLKEQFCKAGPLAP